MKAYLAILRCRFSALFQYRAAAIAGLCTQLFWGFIKMMVFTAFFAQASGPQPMNLQQAITFIWLGQSLLQLLPWNVDKEIEQQVKTGNVAYELVRPLDLYWLWFARSLAIRLAPTLMRSIPPFIISGLFLGLCPPASWQAAMTFISSVIFAAILSAAITTFVIISLMWTISGEGLQRLLPHIVVLLSGMILPLPLFPEWMQPFLSLQPFRGIIDIPSRLYTGMIPLDQAHYFLGFQLIWCLVLILAGRLLIQRGLKKLVILGG